MKIYYLEVAVVLLVLMVSHQAASQPVRIERAIIDDYTYQFPRRPTNQGLVSGTDQKSLAVSQGGWRTLKTILESEGKREPLLEQANVWKNGTNDNGDEQYIVDYMFRYNDGRRQVMGARSGLFFLQDSNVKLQRLIPLRLIKYEKF